MGSRQGIGSFDRGRQARIAAWRSGSESDKIAASEQDSPIPASSGSMNASTRLHDSPPRLAVFDVDGTLVDGQHKIISAMNEAFLAHGHPVPSPDVVRGTIGLSLVEAVAALLPGFDPHYHERVARTYGDMFAALRQRPGQVDNVYPGAMEALAELRDAGMLLGIATGKSRRGVLALLERTGMDEFFSTIHTADDGPGKPHPAMLKLAMTEVGAEPGRTVMVGDTTYDMAMARAAGASALGVGWGYHSTEALKIAGAHEIVADFTSLIEAVIYLTGEH